MSKMSQISLVVASNPLAGSLPLFSHPEKTPACSEGFPITSCCVPVLSTRIPLTFFERTGSAGARIWTCMPTKHSQKLKLFPSLSAIQASIRLDIDMIWWLTRSTGYCFHSCSTSSCIAPALKFHPSFSLT